MSRNPRHRYSAKEMQDVLCALTKDELTEYNELVWGNLWEQFAANRNRIRQLENAGFARLRKDNDED